MTPTENNNLEPQRDGVIRSSAWLGGVDMAMIILAVAVIVNGLNLWQTKTKLLKLQQAVSETTMRVPR